LGGVTLWGVGGSGGGGVAGVGVVVTRVVASDLWRLRLGVAVAGTQFTCFTGIEVHLLTPEELCASSYRSTLADTFYY
jgi:hypothetical protein